jgi:hypothetical protein
MRNIGLILEQIGPADAVNKTGEQFRNRQDWLPTNCGFQRPLRRQDENLVSNLFSAFGGRFGPESLAVSGGLRPANDVSEEPAAGTRRFMEAARPYPFFPLHRVDLDRNLDRNIVANRATKVSPRAATSKLPESCPVTPYNRL